MKFFIGSFGLDGSWSESQITIETSELGDDSIAVSFIFGNNIKRDFILSRDLWNRAFIKKQNKNKLILNNTILEAFKRVSKKKTASNI